MRLQLDSGLATKAQGSRQTSVVLLQIETWVTCSVCRVLLSLSPRPDHPLHNCKLDTTLGWEVSEIRMDRACVDSQQMLGSKQVQLPTPCWWRAYGLESHLGHWTESKRGSSGQRPGSLPREFLLGFSRKQGPISHSYSEGPAKCPLNSIPKEALLEHCLVRKKAEQ